MNANPCDKTRDLFLESPGNLTGPKSYFEIKVSRKVGCVVTSYEVHFVSLADNLTAPFSKLLKLLSLRRLERVFSCTRARNLHTPSLRCTRQRNESKSEKEE